MLVVKIIYLLLHQNTLLVRFFDCLFVCSCVRFVVRPSALIFMRSCVRRLIDVCSLVCML